MPERLLEEILPVCLSYRVGAVIDAQQIKDLAQLSAQSGLTHRESCRYLLGRHTVCYQPQYLLLTTRQVLALGRPGQLCHPVEEPRGKRGIEGALATGSLDHSARQFLLGSRFQDVPVSAGFDGFGQIFIPERAQYRSL